VHVPTTEASWLALLLVELARRAVPRVGHVADDRWIEAVRASGQLATTFYFRFDLLRGVVHSLRCVRLAERAGAPALAALALAQLGYVAGGLRLHRLAHRCFRRAYAHRAAGGHLSAVGAGLYFNAMYEMGMGHWEASERLGQEALGLLEQIGDRQEAEVARTVVANTLYFAGRFRESAACCQAVLESARARSNVQHVGWGQFLTGRALLVLGEPQEAVELLARGREALLRVSDFVSLVMCEGLLAKALLVAGQQDRSVEVADGLSERLRARRIVPLAQCLDGYAALADVYLRVWSAQRGERDRRAARRACADLGRFARIYPIARPAALRSLAWRSWLAGQRARALRLWERSVRTAVDLHMPYDEARGHQVLAQVAPVGGRREQHAAAASTLLARLGCAGEPLAT
jgi:tetratricopeptide (TPR) repeat protein